MSVDSGSSVSATQPLTATAPPTILSSADEVVVTCLIDAPRTRVFKAWTEPERLMRWWAPKGWTTPFCTVDLRPGGIFHYCMRSPEGRDIWGRGVYHDVVEPEQLVYADAFSDEQGRLVEPARYGMSPDYPTETLVTVTFAERDGATQVTLHHAVPESAAERAALEQGWTEMLDRLAHDAEALGVGYVGAMRVETDGNDSVFTRRIDAARTRVFRAWIDPAQLAKWWGPEGFTNPVCQVDARPGGAYRIVMRAPDGVEFPVTGVYREVVEPERLVFTDVADELPAAWHEQLNSYRGQEAGAAPPQMVVSVTFDEQDGGTRLAIRTQFESPVDRDAILKMGAAEGWAQSLDRLQAHLAMH